MKRTNVYRRRTSESTRKTELDSASLMLTQVAHLVQTLHNDSELGTQVRRFMTQHWKSTDLVTNG